MHNFKQKKFYLLYNGFTMPEIIIGIVISTMVIGGLIILYITSYNIWAVSSIQASLTQKANLAMDKMLRGVDGTNGIREATSFTLTGNSQVTYTGIRDATERSFYLSGNEIKYSPDTSAEDSANDIIIASDTSSLTFTEINNKRVKIELTQEQDFRDKTISFTLKTDVHLRN